MNKDGIGITARINKFLALASQYGLELKSEQVIWAFQNVTSTEGDNIDFQMKKYNTFGTLNDNDERVIELIGNILGMFADGAKKPIPAALYMNQVNAGVTLAMVGVGLQPEFAFGFNFIPEIRNAVDSVLAVRSAVSESNGNNFTFLNNEVKNELNNLIIKNPKEFEALKQLGVITNQSQAYRVVVQRENISMEFEANKLDKEKLNNNTLTSGDIGYKIKAVVKTGSMDPATNKKADKNSTIDLTEVQQRMVLLQMYADQAQQTFAIGRAGSLLDMFKKLNPKFTTFDKLLNNIIELKDSTDKSIFTEESTKRIFEDNQVWPQLLAAMEDLHEQAGKLFLERTEFFAPIKNLFESVFTDHSQIAKIITSFVAIRKYQMSMPGSRTSSNEAMTNLIAQDDNNLIETFTAEYPFTNTLGKELEEMQKKYPTNKFLQVLRVDKTENTAVTPSGRNVNESMIKMISKSKAKGKYADEISDDAYMLMLKENMFMKKLFYHEMLRTGLQYTPGSFLQLLSPDLQLPFSKYITEFISNLEKTKGNRYKLVGAIKNSMGPEFTDQDVYSMFDELFLQMAHAATKEIGNNRIKIVDRFSFKDSTLLMQSFKFQKENPKEKFDVVAETLRRFMGQAPASKAEAYTATSTDPKTKKAYEEILIDMSVPGPTLPQVTETTMAELGKKLGVRPAFDDPGNYMFPLMFTLGKNTYMLQGVGDQMNNKSFGESMIKSIVGTGKYINVGQKAKYTLVPDKLTTGTISSIGLNKDVSEKYIAYSNKTARLPFEPAIEEVEVVEREVTSFGERIIDGVYLRKDSLTKEEQLEMFQLLKPYLEQQATKSNKGTFANKMIGLGLRWDYLSNNPGRTAVNIPNIIDPKSKTKYGYFTVAANGEPLGAIPARLKQLMSKATGIDATNYDGAIINIYDDKTFISSHNDVDESIDAVKYPVIVANIGGPGNFAIERVGIQKPLELNAGDSYVFGLDGSNRAVYHRTFANAQKGFLPEIITSSDGKTYNAGSYRISITLRRVMPLSEGMPKTPAKTIVPSQVETTPATQPIIKPKFTKTDNIINRTQVQNNKNVLFVFGDNNVRKGLGGQAKEMRGEPNSFGISTKKLPARSEGSYMTDTELEQNKKVMTEDVNKIINAWNTGNYIRVIVPQIGVGLAELPTRAPQTYLHLQSELQRLENVVNGVTTNESVQAEIIEDAPAEVEQTDTANEMVGTEDATSMLGAMFAQMQEQAVEIPSTIEPGQYVKYLNETFIVTQINNNGTVQVYNPTLEGPASKRSVSSANLTPIAGKATFVNYRNAEYMVTPKNTIISMTTNKAMEWAENDGNRRAIVEIAKKVNANALDIKNLNMTAAVLDTLYEQSSKRMTKDAFSKAATEMVINMRATTTPENILEKIKCL
jgi:hypothetical protein